MKKERPRKPATVSGRTPLLCLLLAAGIIAIYGRVAHAPFLRLDDPYYVSENSHVQEGLNWRTVRWALTATDAANWHPLTWISHLLDYQLFGLDPMGHHFTSILIHVINAILLFVVLQRVTRAAWRSWLVAALFALHPLNVESVAWISERKNVLCTLFFLLTLGAYGWYARKPGIQRYLAVGGLFALGLAAKPMVITLPFVLLLLDSWPLQRIAGWGPSSDQFPVPQQPLRGLVLEKLPLLGLSCASAVITVFAQRSGHALASFEIFPFSLRLQNAIYSYALYVRKALWPAGLAPYYPHPGNTLAGWKVGLALAFLLGISAFVWRARQEHRYLVTGWLWFLGTLVPVIGLVQVGGQAMADRYAYIPLLGLFVMAIWRLGDLAGNWDLAPVWRVAAGGVVLAMLSIAASRQAGYWASSYNLWAHTLDVTQNNFRAEDYLGLALVEQDRYEEAFTHFQNAATLRPEDDISRINLGALLAQNGQLQEAIPQYQAAIQLTPDVKTAVVAYSDLGAIYHQLGDDSSARANYLQALNLDPQSALALEGLAGLEPERMARPH